MNDDVTLDPSKHLPVRIEAAPAFGQGSMPSGQERTFVLLAHLLPVVIWPWKRGASPAVDAHGKEALNMGITLMIFLFPLGIVACLLSLHVVAAVVSWLISFAMVLLMVIAALKAQAGWLLPYPFNLRIIK